MYCSRQECEAQEWARARESERRQANEKGKESDSLQARDLRDQRDESDAIGGTLHASTGTGDKRDAAGVGRSLNNAVPLVPWKCLRARLGEAVPWSIT